MTNYHHHPVVLLLFMLLAASVKSETGTVTILNDQRTVYEAQITVNVTTDVCPDGWRIKLNFPKAVRDIEVWNGFPRKKSGTVFMIKNKEYNSVLLANTILSFKIRVLKMTANANPAKPSVTFMRVQKAVTFPTITPPAASTSGTFTITSKITWKTGFQAVVEFPRLQQKTSDWEVTVAFSRPVFNLEAFNGIVVRLSRYHYKIKPEDWNANQGCKPLKLELQASKSQKYCNPSAVAYMNFKAGNGRCPVTTIPSTNSPPFSTTNKPVTTESPIPSTSKPSTTESLIPTTSKSSTTEYPTSTTGEPSTTVSTSKPSTTESPTPTTGESSTTVSTSKLSTTESPTPTTGEPSTTASTSKPSTTESPIPTTNETGTTESPPQTTSAPIHSTTASSSTTILPTTSPDDECTEEPSTDQPLVTTEPNASPTTPLTSSYNYQEVLRKSILFYEAQRSGKLPSNNRVSWRKDSALKDRGENGEDLTGGWYDAGDYVKFGFPMASSVTVLAWGLVEYRKAYKSAGELNNMLDSIKWATDYFVKAHTAKYEFYGQVGNGKIDHAYWGRPEDMKMVRPAYKITKEKPGSELAAETAAALAASSIAFLDTDVDYAKILLRHAKELYDFADKYRGIYSESITDASNYYKSHSGFRDELVWGAAWLYRATGDTSYLIKAESYYSQFGLNSKPWSFSWDEKTPGVQLLLAKLTGKDSYKQDLKTFLKSWLPGGDVKYTPKGLAWRAQWGPNRYSANVAFIALLAADLGLNPSAYRGFARKQIHYMLGDSGRSYVVGFGNNPPQRPHHASSSCRLAPYPCNWNDFNQPGPNPQVLYGALVGGPDQNDYYEDRRNDYIKNEVATDYNAGFQSAVAGLIQLAQ